MDGTSAGDSAIPGKEAGTSFLRPSDLTPQLAVVPGADPEWVEIGQRYWAWHGFRANSSTESGLEAAAWVETIAKIAADVGEPSGRLYVLAAAGVVAMLPAFTCSTCEKPLRCEPAPGSTKWRRAGTRRRLAPDATQR